MLREVFTSWTNSATHWTRTRTRYALGSRDPGGSHKLFDLCASHPDSRAEIPSALEALLRYPHLRERTLVSDPSAFIRTTSFPAPQST